MYITSGILGVSAVAGTATLSSDPTIGHTAQHLAASGLAATGVNVIWLLLAAFALLSAGLAVLRIAPRREA